LMTNSNLIIYITGRSPERGPPRLEKDSVRIPRSLLVSLQVLTRTTSRADEAAHLKHRLLPRCSITTSSADIERSAWHFLDTVVTFARRGRQFRLHHCSALCRLEKLAVPHRPYKARRRALRLSRMLQFQCSRRRLACPLRLAAQRDQGDPLRRERLAVLADPLRPFLLLCPVTPPAHSLRFRPAAPGDRGGPAHPFRPLALPVPAVRFLHEDRRPPAVLAVPFHPFLRSFPGVQRTLEDLPHLPGRVVRKHLGRLHPL
jgi:hypothetical protein